MLCEVTDRLYHRHPEVLKDLLLKCGDPGHELSSESEKMLVDLRFLVEGSVPGNIQSHLQKNFRFGTNGEVRMIA